MSEIRTLCLTDVVDSTKLAETLGDERNGVLWAEHDRLARELVASCRGFELERTDGIMVMFEHAADAVKFALAYHRAVAALDPPLTVRAGIHSGPLTLRHNPPAHVAKGAKPLEVDGLGIAITARAMSIARPGQTLLTSDAAGALGETSLRVESHGYWRMKGVAEPLELLEVGDEHSPFTPPEDGGKVHRVVADGDLWRPVREVRHQLPHERDAFVGRREDLVELSRRIDDGARLVSVLGIGGTGKTRLVTRFAWTWLGDFPGGAWFCDLSEARSVEGILSAVASGLAVPLSAEDAVKQLGHAIAGRGRCLVVLDNFEQVSRHADATLGRWLDRAPEARFIVTTREVLGLPGESSLALAPLRAPEGIALFIKRAESAKRDFRPTADDLAVLGRLVKLLDGLPLAIELAAARVRVMDPAMLVARMGERFKLLSSGGARRDRQATLRGALDWSWELLSEPERAALAQLSVFEGGFTLESAEAVLDLVAWPDAPFAMNVVQSLVEKSLVRQVSGRRFDLLVTVQEYAAEHLRTEGRYAGSGAAAREAAETRHGVRFATFGTGAELEALSIHGGVEKLRQLGMEVDNLVSACRRAIARGDARTAVATLAAAWPVMQLRGPFVTAVELGREVLTLTRLEPILRARALTTLGAASFTSGRVDEARAHFQSALAIHRDVGNRHDEGDVLGNLGDLHKEQGRKDEARSHYESALAIHREVGDRRGEGRVLGNLGNLHQEQGRMDEARAHLESALAIHREVGDRRFEGSVLGNLGAVHSTQGRMNHARAHYESALAIDREVGNRRGEGRVLGNLGILERRQGRMDEARAHYDAALMLARDVGDRRFEGNVLGNLGNLHAAHGRRNEAQACQEEALVIVREVGNRRNEAYILTSLGHSHVAQGRRDEGRACLERAHAIARDVGERLLEGNSLRCLGDLDAVDGRTDDARARFLQGESLLRGVGDRGELAQLLCARARCEGRAGARDAAGAALAEAQSIAEALSAGPDSELGQELARTRAALDGAAP
jgi:predicted ATPase/class 3 adenylate cyclase